MKDVHLVAATAFVVAAASFGIATVQRCPRRFVKVRGNAVSVLCSDTGEFIHWNPLERAEQADRLLLCFGMGEARRIVRERRSDPARLLQWQAAAHVPSRRAYGLYVHPVRGKAIAVACVIAFVNAYAEEVGVR
ncbi:hypothetical protein EON81_03030 [bacterium]|nr:MAG: hypothetical protein EON81_03030 [bacterium]